MSDYLFTLVTPTYNQGQYIEETIDSVLSQDCSDLQYIIIDGGSNDETIDIVRKYEKYLFYWTSEPDSGPWEAIIKGFRIGSGQWFNWLNSDDLLLPGGLKRIRKLISEYCEPKGFDWLSCGRLDISENGEQLRSTCPWEKSISHLAFNEPFFPQDATWMRYKAFDEAYKLVPTSLSNIFDTCLHDILLNSSAPLLSNSIVSAMRWHDKQLTANEAQICKEKCLPNIIKLRPKKTLKQKCAQRLCRTRFHLACTQIVRLFMAIGFLKCREYWAVVYSPYSRRDEFLKASVIFLERNF